jgi:hypothetical protein
MDREKEAWEELERSTVGRGSRWLLVGAFLVSVFSVFAFDLWEPYGPRDAVRAFTERSRPIESDDRMFSRIHSWNREVLRDIDSFEAQIEDESFLSQTIPFYQWVMVRVLRTSGTGRVLIGQDDWYFLKEGLESTLGWGASENLREADAAIRRLSGMLAQGNIALVLVPIPGKADLHPSQFSSRFSTEDILPPLALRERFYQSWASLPGVEVLPVRGILTKVRISDQSAYLERDTHWTPAGMQATARALAGIIADRIPELSGPARAVSGPGDLVEMMRLPEPLTRDQRVEVKGASAHENGERTPEVLFLGDSFAAIYSDPVLGWGEKAGLQDIFPELMETSVDFRLNYGDPVSGPGRQLGQVLNSSQAPRLQVIVWEFAERFLDEGEWDKLFR